MNKLRIIRTIKNITQWDLTEATGIPNYRISLFEKGRIAPNPDELAALAKALGVTPDQLLDEHETKSLESLVREVAR